MTDADKLYTELEQIRPDAGSVPCPNAQRRIDHLADVGVRFTSLPLAARSNAEARFRSAADDVLSAAPRDCWADRERLTDAIEDMAHLLDERGAVPSTAEAHAAEMREGAGAAALERRPADSVRCVAGRDESDIEDQLGEVLVSEPGRPTDVSLSEGGMDRLYACMLFSER